MLEGSTEGKEFAYADHWDLVQLQHQQKTCHSCGSGSWLCCDSVSELQNQ